MKKPVSLLLAVCMSLSVGVMLTACGHEHTYQTEWSKDSTHHWHACEGEDCTEVSDKAEHTWNDGEITTEATADADGVKTFTCTACGQTKTEPVEYTVKSTVTAEEWTTALNTLAARNTRIAMGDGDYEFIITNSADLIKEMNKQQGIEHTIYYANENGMSVVYEQVDGSWFKYPDCLNCRFSYWGDGNPYEQHSWAYRADDYSTTAFVDEYLPIELFEFSKFSPTEENEYYCKSIEIKYSSSSDFLTDIYISFENGAVSEIKYNYADDTEDNPIYSFEISCKAEDIVISLPEMNNLVVLPTDYTNSQDAVTRIRYEYDWQKAIADFENSNIYFESSDGKKITILNDKIQIIENGNADARYYAIENEKIFAIYKDEDEWVKSSAGDSWDLCVGFAFSGCRHYEEDEIEGELFDLFDEFEYDYATNEYYLEQYGDFSNIRLSFKNGELIRLTYSFGVNSCEFVRAADAHSFTLPEATLAE